MPTLLALPLEIRLQIYSYLLTVPPYNKTQVVRAGNKPCPSILSVCQQIHAEALPALYTQNQFLAHYSLLTSLPKLRMWYPSVSSARVLPLIRRWYVRVRLDTDAPWDTSAVTAAFTGADEVVVEVWQAMFLGTGHGVLRRFEGVRGVKRVRIFGSTTGFEGYARWLEGVMRMPEGKEVGEYVQELEGDDEKEVPFVEKWW